MLPAKNRPSYFKEPGKQEDLTHHTNLSSSFKQMPVDCWYHTLNAVTIFDYF